MVSVNDLYLRVQQLSGDKHSGYTSPMEFNPDLNAVSLELAQILYSAYVNQNQNKALDMLSPLIVSEPYSTTNNGLVPLPLTKMHTLVLDYVVYSNLDNCGEKVITKILPITKLQKDQISDTFISASRKPNIDLSSDMKSNIYYITENGNEIIYPQGAHFIKAQYIKYPKSVNLAYTISTNGNGEVVNTYNPTLTIDFEWNMDAFNILTYMLLSKKGMQVREFLLNEFANNGIQIELS